MNISENEVNKALETSKYVEWMMMSIRDYVFGDNPRLLYIASSLQKNRFFGWNDFIEQLVQNPDRLSEKWILALAQKHLKHKFNSTEEVYRTVMAIAEDDVFEVICDTLSDMPTVKGFHIYGDAMDLRAGKDETDLYFYFNNPLSLSEQKELIRQLSINGYYRMYRMAVTSDLVMIKLANK